MNYYLRLLRLQRELQLEDAVSFLGANGSIVCWKNIGQLTSSCCRLSLRQMAAAM